MSAPGSATIEIGFGASITYSRASEASLFIVEAIGIVGSYDGITPSLVILNLSRGCVGAADAPAGLRLDFFFDPELRLRWEAPMTGFKVTDPWNFMFWE